MKNYVIDDLRPADHEKLKSYLDGRYAVPGFSDLYHIQLPPEILTEVQKDHADCQPFYFAVELFPDRLVCELLVRTNQRIRCQCIHYADENQRNWFIGSVDAIFDSMGIIT